MFGTISKCVSTIKRIIPTLQEYKEVIEDRFKEGMMQCNMIDVMLVPDYQNALKKCIDPKLQNLHKEIDTQHQWQFEAVEPSVYFPLGCRTAYRAYCSDRVVELVKKNRDHCQSLIGRFIGLEAVTVNCRWYPSAECLDGRQGETSNCSFNNIC